MKDKRIFEIMSCEKIYDVFYDKQPVWIQKVQDNIATIGFMDNTKEKDVNINDLYEKTLL